MAFKMNPPYIIDNTPIYRTGTDYTINGETKTNGSIIIANDISDPKELANVISHEKVHVDQLKRGDLKVDDKNYYWKGKAYSIKNFKTAQQRKKAPWEKEAYRKEKYSKFRKTK